MKILVVQYLPGGERSNTRKVLEACLEVLKGRNMDLQTLDISRDLPDLLTPAHISVYYERNFGGQKVSAERGAVMAKMDRMTAQLKSADILLLAYPMYNFSLPAAVKAWLDSVMQKGETWDLVPSGYVGLLKGKKALVITSSGGTYDGDMAFLDHSATLAKTDLGFMGFETEVVSAAGLNRYPDQAGRILEEARKKAAGIVKKWTA
jgi:FMN-dependent NADH-azoreductase